MDAFIKISRLKAPVFIPKLNEPFYFIILMDGKSSFSVDFNDYEVDGKHILFLSPYQLFKTHSSDFKSARYLQFHGDFYCIEYHKAEIACNGILFNNIYEKPFIAVDDNFFNEIMVLFNNVEVFEHGMKDYDLPIARSYLQLVLALCSREKLKENKDVELPANGSDILNFKTLLDTHFASSKSVSFYADHYGLSVNAFSKKIKKHYAKAPSKLIQERLILEAKRLLHLTYKSIKEISTALGFDDEFYFSRYFKKEVGVSPKTFREEVGISIVAEKSR